MEEQAMGGPVSMYQTSLSPKMGFPESSKGPVPLPGSEPQEKKIKAMHNTSAERNDIGLSPLTNQCAKV
jgi:hypothetical protein